jgi:DUF438 domain-containing protein
MRTVIDELRAVAWQVHDQVREVLRENNKQQGKEQR